MKVFKNIFKIKSPAEKHRQFVSLQINEMMKILKEIEKNTKEFRDPTEQTVQFVVPPNFFNLSDNLFDALNRLTSEREEKASKELVNNLIKDIKQNLVK